MNSLLKYLLFFGCVAVITSVFVVSSMSYVDNHNSTPVKQPQKLVELDTGTPNIKCYALSTDGQLSNLNCLEVKP